MPMKPTPLPVVSDCGGCGVCCMHMGYPAFQMPRRAFSKEEIQRSSECQQLLESGWTADELQRGLDGEIHWHRLPEPLKAELMAYIDNYQKTEPLDGACCWFDIETRACRHHQYRPQVCRDFEIGSELCHQWRREYKHLIR